MVDEGSEFPTRLTCSQAGHVTKPVDSASANEASWRENRENFGEELICCWDLCMVLTFLSDSRAWWPRLDCCADVGVNRSILLNRIFEYRPTFACCIAWWSP